jgi:hypothetical protein
MFAVLFRAEQCLAEVGLWIEIYCQRPDSPAGSGMSELRSYCRFPYATLHIYQTDGYCHRASANSFAILPFNPHPRCFLEFLVEQAKVGAGAA